MSIITSELYSAIDYINSIMILENLEIPLSLKKKLMEKIEKEIEDFNPNDSELISLVEKSEKLGYKISNIERSKLGKFVRLQGILPVKKEKIIINGEVKMMNVYENYFDL
jgi:hypothetical protein